MSSLSMDRRIGGSSAQPASGGDAFSLQNVSRQSSITVHGRTFELEFIQKNVDGSTGQIQYQQLDALIQQVHNVLQAMDPVEVQGMASFKMFFGRTGDANSPLERRSFTKRAMNSAEYVDVQVAQAVEAPMALLAQTLSTARIAGVDGAPKPERQRRESRAVPDLEEEDEVESESDEESEDSVDVDPYAPFRRREERKD